MTSSSILPWLKPEANKFNMTQEASYRNEVYLPLTTILTNDVKYVCHQKSVTQMSASPWISGGVSDLVI